MTTPSGLNLVANIGVAMQFSELVKKLGLTDWKVMRTSHMRNIVYRGICAKYNDPIPGSFCGWAYIWEYTVVVHPETGEVLNWIEDHYDEYDY